MNQRFLGRRSEASVSEIDGQLSLFDSFNETEYLKQDSLKEPEITEVVIPSYHRKKRLANASLICPDSRHVSSNIHFPLKNWLPDFLTATKSCQKRSINVSTSFRKPLSWMNIISMSMLPKIMTEQS